MSTSTIQSVRQLMPLKWELALRDCGLFTEVCNRIYKDYIPKYQKNKYHCNEAITKLKCLYKHSFMDAMHLVYKGSPYIYVYRRSIRYIYYIKDLNDEIQNMDLEARYK